MKPKWLVVASLSQNTNDVSGISCSVYCSLTSKVITFRPYKWIITRPKYKLPEVQCSCNILEIHSDISRFCKSFRNLKVLYNTIWKQNKRWYRLQVIFIVTSYFRTNPVTLSIRQTVLRKDCRPWSTYTLFATLSVMLYTASGGWKNLFTFRKKIPRKYHDHDS